MVIAFSLEALGNDSSNYIQQSYIQLSALVSAPLICDPGDKECEAKLNYWKTMNEFQKRANQNPTKEHSEEGIIRFLDNLNAPTKVYKPQKIYKPITQDPKNAGNKSINREPSTFQPEPNVPQATMGNFGEYYAVIIGNNKYEHLDPLNTPIADAYDIATLLQNKYGFQVEVMENANSEAIMTKLAELRRALRKTDNLLLYYGGHGWMDPETGRGYWLPVDADKSNQSKWIPNDSITNELKAIQANHILVVADSCYSGTLTRGASTYTDQGSGDEYIARMWQRRSRDALTSGGLEPVLDSGGGKHSVFAKAFLDVLSDNNQVTEMSHLFEQLKRRVVLDSPQTTIYSNIRYANHEDGDFIFKPNR